MAVRILVVDDEPQIRTVLRAYLSAEGFEILEADSGPAAITVATGSDGEAPDLVLLDIGLPDLGGIEVLQRIRAVSELPVILVTARAEEVDKLVGLSVGADDYITKPFSPREVVARVKTVLRRSRLTETRPSAPATGALAFDGLTIDPDTREITTPSGLVPLSALEFDLLLALASSPGRVFSRAQLLEQVWGYDFYGDERVVDVHIRGMRAALGDDAANPSIIGTVRGVGYKFLKKPLA